MTFKSVIKSILVLLALLGLGAGIAGYSFYREMLEASLREELIKAQAGSPGAQLSVGTMHLVSTFGKLDVIEAEKWLRLAAQHEIHSAKEFLEVIRVTREADETDPTDQYLLGLAENYGLRGIHDPTEVWMWLLLAAANGHPDARLLLAATRPDSPGLFAQIGKFRALSWASAHGLPRPDLDRLLTVNHEDRAARAIFDVSYFYGSVVNPDMPEAIISPGHPEVVADYLRRAERGEAEAQMILAKAYGTTDSFVPERPEEAAKWYLRAANPKNRHQWGYVAVLRRLGELYLEGYGVPRSIPAAFEWYRRAAELGDAEAQFDFALALERHTVPPRDYPLIAHWLGKAAGSGHVRAAYFYAGMLNAALGVPQDRARAYYWASMADAEGFTLDSDLSNRIKGHLSSDQRKAIDAEVERALSRRDP